MGTDSQQQDDGGGPELARANWFDDFWRRVNGALKCTIDAHGPITRENYGSAGKRIASQLAAEDRSNVSNAVLRVIVHQIGGLEACHPYMSGACAAIHARVMGVLHKEGVLHSSNAKGETRSPEASNSPQA